MIQVHAREPSDAVHGRRKPNGACDIRIAAPRGDARRRLLGKCLRPHRTCKPRPPAFGEHCSVSKTRDVLQSRQCQCVGDALLGKIEVRDDDDELVHERVF